MDNQKTIPRAKALFGKLNSERRITTTSREATFNINSQYEENCLEIIRDLKRRNTIQYASIEKALL